MKFIHTGDLHYGMKPDIGKPWSAERAQAVKDALASIVRAARDEKVDLLLIAGDLFHHQPLVRDLKEIGYLFASIPDVAVAVIAGNHDRIRDNSAVLSFPWPKNVYYFTESSLSSVYLRRINTEVYGFSYHTREIRDNLLEGVEAPENGRIRILLCHGGDAKHLPLDVKELSEAGFSYCALGHIHKPEIAVPGKVAWCGSPEPLDLTETGPHGYFLGEINDISRQITSLDFVRLAKVQYTSLIVHVTPDSTNAELLMTLSDELARRGSQNIYRLQIKGLRDPDVVFDLDTLRQRFRIAELFDYSEPKYDFSRLFAEHSSDMIGFFIQELDKPDLSLLDKKALYYGVSALLHTTEERGQKT